MKYIFLFLALFPISTWALEFSRYSCGFVEIEENVWEMDTMSEHAITVSASTGFHSINEYIRYNETGEGIGICNYLVAEPENAFRIDTVIVTGKNLEFVGPGICMFKGSDLEYNFSFSEVIDNNSYSKTFYKLKFNGEEKTFVDIAGLKPQYVDDDFKDTHQRCANILQKDIGPKIQIKKSKKIDLNRI